MMTDSKLDNQGIRVKFLAGEINFSLLPCVCTASRFYPTSYPLGKIRTGRRHLGPENRFKHSVM
jgi:hypothetical protein